ncbi:putative BUD23-protein [Ceraceosorus guamensis]|uniref:Putative BUD23-protein n=1 Tax=Ceraceosorus guamensis TaxID=1522189 RepID=A0A316VSW9_9BASI|nr:putative BUD23-protein [Ceraceosorus guamensis]PWN40470.1 putative BUD23-protein [Ceraceosorus guamensis]
MSRPEHLAPPEVYYNDVEASKYTSSTRVRHIQATMAERAMELLAMPAFLQQGGGLLLDIGCGSGLSGEVIQEAGHEWVGVDISPSMLDVALQEESQGDLLLGDVGEGLAFRPGMFDGAISISVLQWLLNADKIDASPIARLSSFFTTLHAALRNGARAVLQFYPESDEQVRLCMQAATRAGFGGGLVVDYPNSKKAKKLFLVLWVGGVMLPPPGYAGAVDTMQEQQLPRGLVGEHEDPDVVHGQQQVKSSGRRQIKGGKADKKSKSRDKGKDWILRKKDLYRKRGKEDVPTDSKYTGRKRKTAF